MSEMLTRRAVLGAALGAATGAGLAGEAAAQGDVRISSIEIDVRPILAGWGPNTQIVREVMLRVLRRDFASRFVPRGGARLIVVVKAISLTSYAGSTGRRGFGSAGGETDYMESDAILVGPRGDVIAKQTVLSALDASSGGPWYLENVDQRRIAAIAEHNAWWIKVQLVGRG